MGKVLIWICAVLLIGSQVYLFLNSHSHTEFQKSSSHWHPKPLADKDHSHYQYADENHSHSEYADDYHSH